MIKTRTKVKSIKNEELIMAITIIKIMIAIIIKVMVTTVIMTIIMIIMPYSQ